MDAGASVSAGSRRAPRPARSRDDAWRGLIGQSIGPTGRYRVVSHLGSGYIADVVGAIDGATGERWAAKVFAPTADGQLAADRERTALIALAYPRVPRFHDAFIEDGRPIVVTDLIDGESLRQRVERDGPLDRHAIQRLASDLTEVFQHIAATGWTYRDLHPRNIHLTTRHGARLIDFDGARPSGYPAAPSGRRGYRAPELVSGGPITVAADVFSVAGCLIFAAAGNDPSARPTHIPPIDSSILDRAQIELLAACRRRSAGRRPTIADVRAAFETTMRPAP